MKLAVAGLALCLSAAAAAVFPIEKAVVDKPAAAAALPADLATKVEQVKEMMTKGFFEDLAQVSQNIIQHAHMVAEQIIMSIDEAAHQALQNLQKDKPEAITLSPALTATSAPVAMADAPVDAAVDLAVDAMPVPEPAVRAPAAPVKSTSDSVRSKRNIILQ